MSDISKSSNNTKQLRKMSFSPKNFNDDDQSPATPKTPRATRHSRSSQANAPQKPSKNVSFKKIAPDSPPLAPKALSFADIDSSNSSSTEPAAVRKNSREFRRSISPAPADKDQAVVVAAKPRERQAAHWVKFHKISLGRARTAKMNHNETVADE
jgi:hypothetical protein